MSAVGKNIKNRREELGMNQDDLALLMGYKSKTTISKIESGINDLTPSKIVKFAEALKTSPAVLMGWKPITEETPEEQAELDAMLTNDPELMKLMKKIAKLDAKGRKAVTQLVDTLTE